MNSGQMANWIEMPFEMVGWVSPRNRILDGRAHWRHLANTVERLYAAAMSGSATNLLWAILLYIPLS